MSAEDQKPASGAGRKILRYIGMGCWVLLSVFVYAVNWAINAVIGINQEVKKETNRERRARERNNKPPGL